MTAATSSRLLAELPKNKREVVRVTVDDWQGRRLLNLRVWWQGENGEWRPGKQGLAVRLDLAADLARAVAEAAT